MELSADTRMLGLIEKYPHLLDVLVDLSPEFARLKNPFLRKTLGRRATLGHAARMSGIPLEQLIQVIREAVSRTPPSSDKKGQQRIELMKGIIRDLHAGKSVEEQKKLFSELLQEVGPSEVAEMEQSLLKEGMPAEEIKRLCDVHVQVMEQSFQEVKPEATDIPVGHPVDTFLKEIKAVSGVLDTWEPFLKTLKETPDDNLGLAESAFEKLKEIDRHFIRKENQLFPVLERHGITAPSKVMWALHDDIRDIMRTIGEELRQKDIKGLVVDGLMFSTMLRDMIYKEEKILFPLCMDTLTPEEWGVVETGSDEIGYTLIEPEARWSATGTSPAFGTAGATINLSVGTLTPEQINLMLTHLPVDMTFVDEYDEVRYYSAGAERIFPRSPGIIGRNVNNCHPPASVHVVEQIVNAFRSGQKDSAEFWIELKGRFLHIRYFAVRDASGTYKGTVEVSQDVTAIRALEGQRRLLDW